MKHLGFWLFLLVPGLLHAQHATSAQQKFIPGGTIRLLWFAKTLRALHYTDPFFYLA
jgi:hypothetical protein